MKRGRSLWRSDGEAERLLRERRANAQSLLISLAADAATYTDQRLRARTLARIGDALPSLQEPDGLVREERDRPHFEA